MVCFCAIPQSNTESSAQLRFHREDHRPEQRRDHRHGRLHDSHRVPRLYLQLAPGTRSTATETNSLRIPLHHHYDHSEADTYPNIVFPLDTLRELAGDGIIAGVNDKHYSYGFTTRLRELYETTFPQIADKVERSKARLVLLTAGCPETRHRSIANMAREIEAGGVPTLIISASPAATESVRPPRAMTFDGSEIGRIVGRAGDRPFHKQVLRAALEMFTHDTPPGRVVSKNIR